jgi:hypothetical protein
VVAFLQRRGEIDLVPLRRLGAAMLGLALLLPRLPHDPGLPCPLRTVTGIPCPLCGMTTSVKAGMHLDVRGALAANPFGVAAVIAAVMLIVRPAWRRAVIPASLVVTSVVVSELFQLHRYHFL